MASPSRPQRTVAGSRERPRALLFDYGGTLVEEVAFDTRAAVEWLLAHATKPLTDVERQLVFDRSGRVSREVADRRDQLQVETPWPALTRLIYDACRIQLSEPVEELELGFWNAAVETRPMPGVREALSELHGSGFSMGVVSNSSFSQKTIRNELAKHALADFLDVIVVSAEYAVRKPNPMLFEVAAGLLGIPSSDIWFVGDRLDTDIAGANASGMTAIWFAPHAPSTSPSGLRTVASWAELVTVICGARHAL